MGSPKILSRNKLWFFLSFLLIAWKVLYSGAGVAERTFNCPLCQNSGDTFSILVQKDPDPTKYEDSSVCGEVCDLYLQQVEFSCASPFLASGSDNDDGLLQCEGTDRTV